MLPQSVAFVPLAEPGSPAFPSWGALPGGSQARILVWGFYQNSQILFSRISQKSQKVGRKFRFTPEIQTLNDSPQPSPDCCRSNPRMLFRTRAKPGFPVFRFCPRPFACAQALLPAFPSWLNIFPWNLRKSFGIYKTRARHSGAEWPRGPIGVKRR